MLSKELRQWSRDKIDNVFEKVKKLERKYGNIEPVYEFDDSDINRPVLI